MTITGDNIKKLRDRAGMTITDLSNATRVGMNTKKVGRSTISELESGKALNPKSNTITAIAKALGVSIGTLTEMEVEHEYVITDIEEAMNIILSQENLMLHGQPLNEEAKVQLSNNIKMALQFASDSQKRSNK
ncbi:helix-turn-helix domain-containing protein [Clostridium lacusfryxellense]|uniref:helix-turn-helix domain-containing protein n=1 Tax=Clostridium lacusfryxellense TaxID=205328 RepID=UPI001C0BCF88|nr:helix-turn-helix transcriptional regulator [Clostridium lacusfryxellense]MBU3111956.1 helix-turn-helix domain-containing protein [Clostridium lacusfryxellense]